MISSLISRFEPTRRALFVGTREAAAYHWLKNDLDNARLFDLSDEGRRNFRRYLAETAEIPFHILIDVFEEEYRQDTVPHVFGPDRSAILKRKAGRLFKGTPYYFHQVTGREEGGRRDDQVLLTAITNPAVIKPWTAMLDEAKVPLAGIYSLPLFTKSLLEFIDDDPAPDSTADSTVNQLVVSLQSISGLRQTFFHNGKFRMSRLVQMPRYGNVPYGPYIRDEVEKIHRYLNSSRLTTPEQPLDTCFLLAGDLLEELKNEYPRQGATRHHFCDLNELLAKSGLARSLSTPFSDQFFVHQVLKLRPGNFYASRSERRYLSMRRLRYAVSTAGVLLLLAGVVWSGLNFTGGAIYKRRSIAATEKYESYTAKYQLAREGFPEMPVEPADLKVAIDIAATLEKYKSSPIDMVRLLGDSLNRFPAIQVSKLTWFASADPEAGFNAVPAPSNARDTPDFNGAARRFYHVALFEGRIEPFDGDFRGAMEMIERFAEDIRSRDSAQGVSIVALPLDVSPDAELQGNTQVSHDEARFTLRVSSLFPHGNAFPPDKGDKGGFKHET